MLLKNDGALPLKSSREEDRDRGSAGRFHSGARRQLQRHLVALRDAGGRHSQAVRVGAGHLHARDEVPAQPDHDSRIGVPHRGRKPGITAVYFNNKDLSRRGGCDARGSADSERRVRRRWSAAVRRLPDGVGAGDFSARYTGTLKPDDIGQLQLIDQRCRRRARLAGRKARHRRLDQSAPLPAAGLRPDPAAVAARSAELKLEKGKDYALKVEFFQTRACGAAAAAAARAADGEASVLRVRRFRGALA